MKHLDLFSGIGGFALAARWMNWQTIGFVEKDKFCQRVLAKHWAGIQIEEDIKSVTADTFQQHPDIITGGFPCQPFSVAGKRRGTEDDRYLWPEMVRLIKEYKPRWVLGENVAGIIPMELDSVLLDLEVAGYEAWSFVIPACGVDAKHRRARVWIVAHSRRGEQSESSNVVAVHPGTERTPGSTSQTGRSGSDGRARTLADPNRTWQLQPGGSIAEQRERLSDGGEALGDSTSPQCNGSTGHGLSGERRSSIGFGSAGEWFPEPSVGRVANGIPRRVDRLRSLGNAIVPQIAYEIFRAIDIVR